MIEVVSEIGASGWYAEVWLRVGFQKRLLHVTADTFQDADAAEEVGNTWALDALTQFFEFYIAQSAQPEEEPVEDVEKASTRSKAATR
jgi:CO dehydrogenase/acetyl-CoA synthase beta subunit